jgi:hypothetical protein
VGFGSGTLYGLILEKSKDHVCMDREIVELDSMLQNFASDTTKKPKFISITNVLSGKVKTFISSSILKDLASTTI